MSQGRLARRILQLRGRWWAALLLAMAGAFALGQGPAADGAAPRQEFNPAPELSLGLTITPTTGFLASGYTGGPFSPVAQNYRVRNTTAGPLAWSVSDTASWLSLSQVDNWKLGAAAAAWPARSGPVLLSFAGKLWLIGGGDSQVWSSPNGITWTRATAAALPDGETWNGTAGAVFNNALWVSGDSQAIGGNPIYTSTDGITWTLASKPLLMAPRSEHAMVAFNNRLWILGGVGDQRLSDVWSSANGIDWELVTPAAPWGARFNHAAVVYNGKLWVLGGSSESGLKNDVWSTSDGINWVRVTPAAPWTARSGLAVAVHDGKLWVLGGNDGADRNDAWYTRDGVTWTWATPAAPWAARSNHAAISFGGKLWLMAGSSGGTDRRDVYYNETIPLSGTLPAGAAALVEAALNTSANTLAAGSYTGQINFYNLTHRSIEVRTATLRVVARPPTLTVNNIRVSEGNSGSRTVNLTVQLSAPAPAGGASVNYATANGTALSPSDYLAKVGVVTIPAGQTSALLPVTVVGDTRLEPDETFFINLSSPVRVLLGTTRAQVIILNDETVPSTLYVDDNGPGDPAPGNPLVSDPLENGSTAHPFDSIQEAMNIAVTGRTVLVLPGIYRENLNFNGKNITVRSSSPTNAAVVAATIVNGRAAGPVVTFRGTETASCRLYGLTLTGGYAPFGGGILGNGTRATIQYNQIARNQATAYGGGLYRCQGSILNNTITLNQARSLASGTPVAGAGLSDCDGLIRGNTISNNTVNGTGHYPYYTGQAGGGLAFCDGTIESNTISGNVCGISGQFLRGYGGGLYDCQGAIRANQIVNNHCSGYGGGLNNCDYIVINNRIASNFGEWAGGGLSDCEALIMGNTIDSNSSAEDGGGLADCDAHIHANMIRYNHANVDEGGGLFHCPGVIENNVIAGNVSYLGGSGLAYCDGAVIGNTIVNNDAGGGGAGVSRCLGTLANNILWGNFDTNASAQIGASSLPSYSIIQGWTGGGTGNSAANPRFINAANNFHLQSSSPAIDSGSNALVPQDFDDLNNNGNTTEPEPYDRDGNPRIRDGNGDGSAVVDKGAYEYQP